jgi:hypothetical protein
VKNGQPTKAARYLLGQVESTFDYSEILQMYPMREEDMRVLGAYMLGTASIEEAEAALRESLRDPRWMTRWFAKHHDTLTPIIEWLRRPSRNLRASMKEAANRYSSMMELKQATGTGPEGGIPRDYWLRAQQEMLVSTTGMFLDKMDILPAGSILRPEQIDARSPGFAVCIRAMHNSLRDSVGKNAREPKASDFIDCIHALYVPYVDIFRADSYMSGHIAPLAAKHGTAVVQKLRNLPAEISRRLSSPRN